MTSAWNTPLTERLENYHQVIKLKEAGRTQSEIKKQLGLDRATIQNWVRGHRPDALYTIPNLKPSRGLSYLIGVCLGDGFAYSRNRYRAWVIGLDAKDREFVETFADSLSSIIGKTCSVKIKRGLFSIRKKSKLLAEFIISGDYLNIIEIYPKDFLRGFYDSEGSIHALRRKGKSDLLEITVTNTTWNTIQLAKRLLEILGYHPTIYSHTPKDKKWKTCYYLLISRKKEVIRFSKEIGFTIERKQAKLDAFSFYSCSSCQAVRDNRARSSCGQSATGNPLAARGSVGMFPVEKLQ